MEGSDDHYLYVGHGWISWSVWSSLKKEKVYIDSGSAGQPCPAHPRNAPNLKEGLKEWKFNKAPGNTPDEWDVGKGREGQEGGVVLHCSVHNK